MIIDNSDLIKEIKNKISIVDELKQNKEAYDFFIKAFKPRFCWSSNQIEGNTLTLDETLAFIEYDEVKSNHTYTEYSEAKTLYTAINRMLHFEGGYSLGEYEIKTINQIILDKTYLEDNNLQNKGYRTNNVYVGNQIEKIYIPPDFNNVPKLMEEYSENLNIFDSFSISETINKIVHDHINFERIHPFKDGNGRTGRIIMNQQLINNGFLPICITKNSKYNQSFKQFDKNRDYSLLEHILCKEILNTFSIAKDLLKKNKLVEDKPKSIKR